MKTIRRARSFGEIGGPGATPDASAPLFVHVPRPALSSLDAWEDSYSSATTPSTPDVRSGALRSASLPPLHTPTFSSRATTTPTHRHSRSVSDLSRHRLRLRALELELPQLAETLRVAHERLQTTSRTLGFIDPVALRERDNSLDRLVEFRLLSGSVAPTPRRRSGGTPRMSRSGRCGPPSHDEGPDDATLLARLDRPGR